MDRGLDAAGMVCKYQVEIKRYAQAVLWKQLAIVTAVFIVEGVVRCK